MMGAFVLTIVTALGNGVVLEWMGPTSDIAGRDEVLRSAVPSSGGNGEGYGVLVRPICVDRGQAPHTIVRYVASVQTQDVERGGFT